LFLWIFTIEQCAPHILLYARHLFILVAKVKGI